MDDAFDRDADFELSFLAGFMPPAKISRADTIEKHIRLGNENAQPGPITLAPYQRAVCDALDDPDVHTVAVMFPSQSGKSATQDACVVANIIADPGTMLCLFPTDAKAADWMRTRFEPLIASTAAIRFVMTYDSASSKMFAGSGVFTGSARKPDDVAARPVKHLFCDEIDRYPQSTGHEGDPVQLAVKRTTTFKDRKVFLTSTPTMKGASRIHDWFTRGTAERFNIPCPACEHMFAPSIDDLVFSKGDPSSARLRCQLCAHPMTERERVAAVRMGQFVATNPAPEPGVRSFHMTELCSLFSTLKRVAEQFEAVNTSLAEPFEYAGDAISDPDVLREKAENIVSPYPAAIEFVVASIDLQKDRAEALFLGVGPNLERWVLEHTISAGSPEGVTLWRDLADLLKTANFRMKDGRVLPLTLTAIDSGNWTEQAYKFAASNRNVVPVKGRAGWDRPAITWGSKVLGPMRVALVGTDGTKMNVARSLAMKDAGPGAIHLPAKFGPAFFEQCCSEHVETKHKNGFPKHMWVKKDASASNEAFDLLVYATAIATIVRKPAKPLGPTNDNVKTIGQLAAELNAIHARA